MSGVIKRFVYRGRPRFEELEPTHPLCVKAKRQIYVLLEDFLVETPDYGLLIAPAGMTTDRASIPHWAFSYIAPTDIVINWPAIFHDAGYEKQGNIRADGGAPLTKDQLDRQLQEMMLANNASSFVAWSVYQAVHLFGGSRFTPSVKPDLPLAA